MKKIHLYLSGYLFIGLMLIIGACTTRNEYIYPAGSGGNSSVTTAPWFGTVQGQFGTVSTSGADTVPVGKISYIQVTGHAPAGLSSVDLTYQGFSRTGYPKYISDTSYLFEFAHLSNSVTDTGTYTFVLRDKNGKSAYRSVPVISTHAFDLPEFTHYPVASKGIQEGDSIDTGTNLNLSAEVHSAGGLSSVNVKRNGISMNGFPKTTSGNYYNFSVTDAPTVAGQMVVYTFTGTDLKGRTAVSTFTVSTKHLIAPVTVIFQGPGTGSGAQVLYSANLNSTYSLAAANASSYLQKNIGFVYYYDSTNSYRGAEMVSPNYASYSFNTNPYSQISYWDTTNSTYFAMVSSSFDFDNASATSIQTTFYSYISTGAVVNLAASDIVLFRYRNSNSYTTTYGAFKVIAAPNSSRGSLVVSLKTP